MDPSEEKKEEFQELMEQGKFAGRRRERAAKALLRILEDEKAFVDHRIRAATMLGELQYLPAIPALIRNVDLRPSRSREIPGYPVRGALMRFGQFPIPMIVDEILALDVANVRKPDFLVEVGKGHGPAARLYGLLYVLQLNKRTGERWRFVRIYLAGLSATAKDATTRRRAKTFLDLLDRKRSK